MQTIEREGLLHPGDTVVAGVSGGADSMALLHFLWTQKDIPLTVVAAHINHGYRGMESDRDEEFVRRFCAERQIPCYVKRVNVEKIAKAAGKSFEECGRDIRYGFLEELAAEHHGMIATAHTLSDKTETLLFHLTRGSSLKGLCSIPVKRGRIIRPLLDCTRQEVERYCTGNQVEYVQDSTNFSTEYARNKIRLQVIPVLKEINPSLEYSARRLMESLSADSDYLESLAMEKYTRLLTGSNLPADAVEALPEALRLRVIALFLKEHGITADYQRILQVQGMIFQKSGKLNVGTDYFVTVRKGELGVCHKREPMGYFEYTLCQGSNIFPIGSWFVFVNGTEVYKKLKKIYKNFSIYPMDYDRINGSIKLRQRLPQDCIKLPQRRTRTVKKLFNEWKIPPELRDRIPLFTDDDGVFFIDGIGIDQRVQPSATTANYLIILKGSTA